MSKLLENTYVRYGIALAIGAALGAIFYPTKSIEREIEKKYRAEKIKLIKELNTVKSKSREEKQELSSKISKIELESQQKISSLRIENRSLKQKVTERKLKIVKPDGTIVEQSFKESNTEAVSRVITDVRQEFNTKVKSIESKWKKIHEKRVTSIKEKYEKKIQEKDKVITSYKKKESIKVNPRKFGIAFGIMADDQYYSNISYDVYGPWFLNLQVESSKNLDRGSGGVGVGLKF